MGSSFPNLILLIASSGWINSSITQADMFKNHLKYKDTFWDFMCVFPHRLFWVSSIATQRGGR